MVIVAYGAVGGTGLGHQDLKALQTGDLLEERHRAEASEHRGIQSCRLWGRKEIWSLGTTLTVSHRMGTKLEHGRLA